MIISHRHKFVYLKARKVAGTSVEVALSQHCGDSDIVTPVGAFNPKWDEDEYDHPGRNRLGYDRHSTMIPLRRRLGRELWDAYFKFAVVRNPWDLVVSQYHWATRGDVWGHYQGAVGRSLRRFWRRPLAVRKNLVVLRACLAQRFLKIEDVTLEFFVTYMLRYYPPNDRFYFDRSGSVGLDFVIRYENLQDDYESVCARIGIPPSQLPLLKTKSRSERRHYSTYYDDRTRELVAKAYHRHVDHFGYCFEEA
jgi:hypothetical protein